MVLDANHRSHRAKGLPQGLAGTFDGALAVEGDDDILPPDTVDDMIVERTGSEAMPRNARKQSRPSKGGGFIRWLTGILDDTPSPDDIGDELPVRQITKGMFEIRDSHGAPHRGGKELLLPELLRIIPEDTVTELCSELVLLRKRGLAFDVDYPVAPPVRPMDGASLNIRPADDPHAIISMSVIYDEHDPIFRLEYPDPSYGWRVERFDDPNEAVSRLSAEIDRAAENPETFRAAPRKDS
ncbi:hypothetical protein [Bifidobacterium sp. SO1]|uniref:hypothetical protein n=1 Tax=Bifidobacterium sp. SO1 TaxID=2809029 RepID=UPI001BDC5E44|nr:hypothetical protein [Bifidobacterium sp. SO1]MBT1161761.1 hypothetical protein [Bifidobacterium sp. SO1]